MGRLMQRVPYVVAGALAALLLAACGSSPAVSGALKSGDSSRTAASTAARKAASARPSCSPAPCGEIGGFIAAVSSVNPKFQPGASDPAPDPGTRYVQLTVTFSDAGSQVGDANPLDFRLQDSTGTQRDTTFLTGCPPFPDASVAPGRHYGPVRACFEAVPGKLVLIWAPRFGLGGTASIRLNER